MFITTPPDVVPNEVVVVTADHHVKIIQTTRAQEMIERLHKHRPEVRAEMNAKRYLTVLPNDSELTKQSHFRGVNFGIQAEQAWNTTKGSRTVVVAVLDSGVDLHHVDLTANIWVNTKEIPNNNMDDDANGYTDDVSGWDFVDHDAQPVPSTENGPALIKNHGTHVAGIIGAVGNNRIGVSGVAWHVQLMPLRVFNTDGSSDIGSIYSAINYAITNGADVINMSYGGETPSNIEREALERAHAAGIITVAAAGNRARDDSGKLNETPSYPVCYKHILGVAALNKQNQRASFSNFGKKCIDVAAPGTNIYSTVFGGTYDYLTGTSMAAPQVSGTAALLLALNAKFTPSRIHQFITQGATPLEDATLGAGKLNVAASVAKASTENTAPTPPFITAHCSKKRRHCIVPRGESSDHARPYFTWKATVTNERPIVGYYVAWSKTLQDPVQYGQLQTVAHRQPDRLPNQSAHYYLVVRAVNDHGEISPRAVFDYAFVPYIFDP